MITNQNGTIRVYLTSAVTTNELDVTGHYVAMSTSGVVSNVAQIAINTTGTTPLVIMPATLAAGTVGILKNLQVYNSDTVAQTIIIDQYDGTTARVMSSIPLNPGQSLQINADGDLTIIPPTPAGGGSGTVTSVSGTGTVSGITLSGTVTTTGSLTLGGTLAVTPSNFASQSANTFLAAPDGAAGVPTFRVIANNDMPNAGVIAKVLTGFTSGAGTVTAADSILSAIQKLDGNNATNGAWTAFTPTFTNLTVGNGTLSAVYKKLGDKTVFFRVAVTLGSTSSVGSTPFFTLPFTAANTLGVAFGGGSIIDASPLAYYQACMVLKSATEAYFDVNFISGSYVGIRAITSAIPITFAVNDIIYVEAYYETT